MRPERLLSACTVGHMRLHRRTVSRRVEPALITKFDTTGRVTAQSAFLALHLVIVKSLKINEKLTEWHRLWAVLGTITLDGFLTTFFELLSATLFVDIQLINIFVDEFFHVARVNILTDLVEDEPIRGADGLYNLSKVF